MNHLGPLILAFLRESGITVKPVFVAFSIYQGITGQKLSALSYSSFFGTQRLISQTRLPEVLTTPTLLDYMVKTGASQWFILPSSLSLFES